MYDELSNKCISIISKNSPEKSIDKISKLNLPGENIKFGKSSAFKIYKDYVKHSVVYDEDKYKNNINAYKSKLNKNIKIAREYVEK
jgi:hypothetical protein